VTEAEAEFERRYVTTWLDRREEALETAASASEDDYETFCDAYTTAATAADTLANVDERFDHVPESVLDRVDALLDGVDGHDDQYVEATRDEIDAAEDADDPETAVSHWLEAYRRYAAAHEADWEQTGDLPELSSDHGLEDIAEHTVDALVEHAEQLEDEGENREDEDAEAARSLYEDAADRLRNAQGIAEEWTSVDSTDAIRDATGHARGEDRPDQVGVGCARRHRVTGAETGETRPQAAYAYPNSSRASSIATPPFSRSGRLRRPLAAKIWTKKPDPSATPRDRRNAATGRVCLPEQLSRVVDRLDQHVDLLASVVEVKRRSGSRSHAEFVVERLRAVITCPDRDRVIVENRGEVVSVDGF
jgi:hypothetical protein